MKFASLLIPVYLPRAYPSATPAPYQSSTVDGFEREMVALSGYLTRHGNTTRLLADPHGRFVSQQIVTRYDLMVDPASTELGDAILLALRTFALDKVAVNFCGDMREITMGEANELRDGIHLWNAANEPA